MIYFLSGVAGMAAALITGGRFENFLNFKLRKWFLIILGLLIQLAAQIAAGIYSYHITNNAVLINMVVYCLLFSGFGFNKKYAGINTIALGTGLNVLVMMFNNGRMPVSHEMLSRSNLWQAIDMIEKGMDLKHVFLNESSRLVFLADIIEPPGILGFQMRVVSIGDLLVAAGIGVLVFEMFAGRSIPGMVKNWICKRRKCQEGKC